MAEPVGVQGSSLLQRTVKEANESPVAQGAKCDQPAERCGALDLLIARQVKENYESLLSAFKVYDIEDNNTVTKGEFRRVIEINITPINTQDFGKVLKNAVQNRNGSVQYLTFLKYYKEMGQSNAPSNAKGTSEPKSINGKTSLDPNLSSAEVEKLLKAAIEGNLAAILRGFRLFDYNRDKKIQFHELRKILEQYCFSMTNSQFERLWNNFDYSKMGLIDYMEFLGKLGIHVTSPTRPNAPNQASKKKLQVGASGMNLDQLEVEYRKKLKENNQLLKKAFLVLDAHHSGIIPIKNFKSVLDEFVFPTSESEFQKLMERLSFKGSHDVAWYAFLQKFVDPQSLGNGQTLPIRPGHKANPIRGANMPTNVQEIVQLLYNHILSAYSSLRNAFLQIDINRKNKITYSDFKRLLQGFKFEISDIQLKEIMILLDPEHTGFITYRKFLEIFEEKETAEGHKWLISTHKYNKDTKPVILAWKTVEELMQQKIVLRWKEFTNALRYYDQLGTGYISPKSLKKVLDKIALPLSDEHFDSLMKQLSHKNPDGKVNYLEFVAVLKIDIYAGDEDGVSTEIARRNEESLMLRQTQHQRAMAGIEKQASLRTNMMSLEEIIVRLRDRSAQNKQHIRAVFLHMDDGRTGFVSKKKFRQFLESYGIVLSDENFAQLASELEFTKQGLDYMRFVKHFEGRDSELNPSYLPMQNHRFNAIRGDEFGMSAATVEQKLRSKIRENFTTLREAFHKMDATGKGYVTKEDFRRLLAFLMCFTNENEFAKLCERLGIDGSTQLSYRDFLARFQELDDLVTGHKWLVSNHRYNELGEAASMTAEEAHSIMATKVHEYYKDIARAFCHIDYLGRGYITKREFRDLLTKLNIKLEPAEFKKLWSTYDTGNRNAITYQNFLKRIGVANVFSSGDVDGTSFKIIQNSAETTAVHLESQDNRQENIVYNQAVLTFGLDAHAVFLILQKRIKDFFPTTYAAFKTMDRGEKGYLNSEDFRLAIHQLHLFVKPDSFDQLMKKIGIQDSTPTMNYEAFSSIFDEKFSGPRETSRPRTAGPKLGAKTSTDSKAFLKRLRNIVTKDQEILEKVFRSFDTAQEGRIGASDFRRVLDSFCFKLTDSQFKQVLKGLLSQGAKVNYYGFLANFSQSQEAQERREWMDSMQALSAEEASVDMTDEEVECRVAEFVTARPYLLAQEFAELDYAQLGVVSKTDFRDVIFRLVMRMSTEQFDRFAAKVPLNEYGNVNYKEFLLRFAEQRDRPDSPASITPPPPQVADADASGQKSSGVDNDIEEKLQRIVSQSWKSLFAQFKMLDQTTPEKPKQIHIADFCSLLSGFGLPSLTPASVANILRRFGLKADGFFNYQEFVRAFVLDDGSQGRGAGGGESAQLVRKKMQRARIGMAASVATATEQKAPESLELAMRLRRRVLEDWKAMRKAFREQDANQSGRVTAGVFRRLLRRFGVGLNDDEFYSLMSSCDTEHTGCVDYNEFIRSFLRSA